MPSARELLQKKPATPSASAQTTAPQSARSRLTSSGVSARTRVTEEEEGKKKTGLLKTIVQGAVHAPLRAIATVSALKGGVDALITGDVAKASNELTRSRSPLFGLYGSVTPYGVGKEGTATGGATGLGNPGAFAKDVIGAGLEAGLDVVTFGTGSVKSGLLKGAASTFRNAAVKDLAEQGVKSSARSIFTRETAKIAARTTLKEGVIGGTYGTAVELQNPNATVGSVAESAALNAALLIALPKVFGLGYKGTRAGLKGTTSVLGSAVEMAASRLENKAATLAEKRLSRIIGSKTDDLLYATKSVAGKTITESVAETVGKALRKIEGYPTIFQQYATNSLAHVGKLDNAIKDLTGMNPHLMEKLQGTNRVGIGAATQQLYRFVADTKGKYGDNVWGYAKQYMGHLDAIDRLTGTTAQKVQGGKIEAEVHASLDEFLSRLTPGERARVVDAAADAQKFLRNILKDMRDTGRIGDKEYKNILSQHETYVPHRVLDFVADRESTSSARTRFAPNSMSADSLALKSAKGSIREIADFDEAVTDYLYRQIYANEKQRMANAMMKEVGAASEATYAQAKALGFTPEITREQTIAKQRLVVDMHNRLREMRQNMRALLSEARNEKAVTSSLRELERRIAKEEADLAKDVEKFMQDGLVLEKEVTTPRQVRTMPNALLRDAYAAQRAGSYSAFLNSDLGKQLALNQKRGALLEKYGFKSVEDFYNAAKNPFKPEVTKLVQREVKGPKAKELVSGLRKKTTTETKIEFKREVDLPSVKEAVANAKRQLEESKKEIAAIKANLEAVTPEKLAAVDMPEGFERFTWLNDGFKESWIIPEEIAFAMKSTDKIGLSAIITALKSTPFGRMLTAPTRAIKAVATKYSPVFGLFKNPIRDIQQMLFTSRFTAADYAKALGETITGRRNPADTGMWSQAVEHGAFISSVYRDSDTPEAVLRAVQEKLGILGTRKASPLARPFQWMAEATQVLEETARLAAFRRALIDGKTPTAAADIAANATVDFTKGGELTKLLNQVSPFLNARIQGTLNVVKALNKNPDRFARQAMVYVAYPAMLLNGHNTKYESYFSISETERMQNWIIMAGESPGKDYSGKSIMVPHYIKIPKGEVQQVVAGIADRVMNVGREKYPQETGAFLAKLLGSVTPVQDTSFIPTGLSQYTELKSNYSSFRKREIVPEWIYRKGQWMESKNVDPKDQFSELSTSQAARLLGKALNWSPYKIDYVVKTGVVNDLMRTYDLLHGAVQRTVTGEQVLTPSNLNNFEKWSEAPFVRSIIGASAYGATEGEQREEARQELEKNRRFLQDSP